MRVATKERKYVQEHEPQIPTFSSETALHLKRQEKTSESQVVSLDLREVSWGYPRSQTKSRLLKTTNMCREKLLGKVKSFVKLHRSQLPHW